MKLITAAELATMTLPQLIGLYRIVCDELAETEPCGAERENMIASLTHISRAIAFRRLSCPKF